MDKVITTALLIIVSMITAMVLFNAAFPAVIEGSNALSSMADQAQDEIRSEITIIHSSGELDHTGWWQDTNSNGLFDVFVWVKNTGLTRIRSLEHIDVFFGQEGNFTRIPHSSQAEGMYPHWSWELENSASWSPAATLRIVIHHNAPLSPGRFFIRIAAPNGTTDDAGLSM